MKIITKGELPEEKLYRIKCYRCNTLFEFQAKEAKITPDQRDGDYYSIGCPLCNYTCSVAVSESYNSSK